MSDWFMFRTLAADWVP